MSLLDSFLLEPYPFNIWIAVRSDEAKGSGTASDPYHGGDGKLDGILNGLPENTQVHLGPGEFLTQGYAEGVSGGWQVKAGMKIEGAGIGVTTLRLFNHTANARYFGIGFDILTTGKLNYCEVSDLTIDCNLAGAGASTAASAVRLMGDHVKVFRVKAINWGSKDAAKSISVISCVCATSNSGIPETNSANAGLEDCIVVLPGAGNVGLCTALSVANAEEDVFASPETHGKAPFIRHCFVDCGVGTPDANPATAKYRGLAMSWCHGGVIVGNQIHNVDIGGPYIDGQRSTRDVVVRDNSYRNVARGPFWNLGTLATETSPGSLARSGTVGTVSGLSLFKDFEPGTRVRLITSPADYSGVYIVQTKTATSFTVTVPTAGAALVTVSSARKVFGVNRAIVEGNNIELSPDASDVRAIAVVDNNDSSPYVEPPDYVHEQVILRNNKIRYVDNVAPNDAAGTLIELKGVRNIIVQNNVLDTLATASMAHTRCANATYFNNRTPGGVLLRGLNNTTGAKTSELETDAEDAFVMAMFNER